MRTSRSLSINIFLTLFLAVFATAMGAGLVAPLLPVYAHELGAGAFEIGLIFGSFSLTRTLFVPYFGKLSDRKGKKPLLTAGLFLYFLLALLYAFSDAIAMLIFIRLGQGFASAMILPVAQAYVGLITPKHKEGRVMGIFNVSMFGGLTLGPLMGGVLKDWYSIQVSFLSMAALTLFGCLLCLVFLPPETPAADTRSGWSGVETPYLVILRAPLVLSLFVFRAAFTTVIGITWSFLPLLASTRMALSSSAIGVVVMISVLTSGVFQAPMGYVADRFSKKIMVIAGGALGVGAMLHLNWCRSFTELFITNAVLGLAGGVSFPAVMALAVIEGRRTGQMGSVMGLLAMAHSIGMLAGPLMGGLLIDLVSFSAIFLLGALILVAGTSLFVRRF